MIAPSSPPAASPAARPTPHTRPPLLAMLVLLAALALGLAGPASAATLTVLNTNDSGAGSLRQAIASANPGDTITFDPTAFATTQTITLTGGELLIGQSLTLQGPSAGVAIDGNHASRIFHITGGTVALSNLTVQNGLAANSNGGGIEKDAGALTLTGCRVVGNTVTGIFQGVYDTPGAGGGIYNALGALALTGCAVTGNSSQALGGGIYNGGTLELTDTSVQNNQGTGIDDGWPGGRIFNNSVPATLTATRCTIAGNGTTGSAIQGGLYSYGPITLTNCTVTGNASMQGGGIECVGISSVNGVSLGPTVLTDCTISGNSTPTAAQGPGIFNEADGNPNKAPGYQFSAPIVLQGCIVAGNSPAGRDVTGLFQSAGSNLIGSLTASGQLETTGLTDGVNHDRVGTAASPIDPKLGPLLGNGGPTQTMALLPGSPALAADYSATPPATDQRDFPRPQPPGARPDIGAYQTPPDITPPVTMATLNPAAPNGTNGWYTVPVTVTLSANDDFSGVKATYYTLDGGPQQTYAAPFIVSGDAVHTVTYHSVDNVGNTEPSHSLTVKIDATPPATASSVDAQAPTTMAGGSSTVMLVATDNLSGVAATYYSLDNGSKQAYTGPIPVTAPGLHALTYSSVDSAGNAEAAHSLAITVRGRLLHTFAPGLQMIAMTEDYTSASPAAAWDAPAGQILFYWSGSDYLTAATLPAPGQSAWVNLSQQAHLYDIGIPAPTTGPFSVALVPGWNLVGDPFLSAVAESSLLIKDGAGGQHTLAEANALALASTTLYTYPAGAKAYQAQGLAGSLNPYQGYWMYAFKPCTLLVTAPSQPSGRR